METDPSPQPIPRPTLPPGHDKKGLDWPLPRRPETPGERRWATRTTALIAL